MQLLRWQSELSDLKLYFSSFEDSGPEAQLVVNDGDVSFSIVVSTATLGYLISDEEIVSRYWALSGDIENDLGSTFIVEQSPLIAYLLSGSHLGDQDFRHFVLVTYDTCFEVVTSTAPEIRKL